MKSVLLALALISAPVLASAATAPTPAPAPNTFTVEFTNSEGEVLITDQYNRTLYVFDKDIGQPGSVCTAACAETWPPYLLDAQEAASLKAPLGSVARGKGMQLTYNGRPLYLFAYDRVVGNDLGDGIGGVWHYIVIK